MGIVDQTNQQAKGLAGQIARQMARELPEVLGDAKRQVTGEQIAPRPEQPVPGPQQPPEGKIDTVAASAKDKQYVERSVQALQTEMREIGTNKLITELQERIGKGEQISLTSYGELTLEQKQVLNAQMEAVKVRMQKEQAAKPLVEPQTRTKRGSWLFGGDKKKQQVKRDQTHVEKPVQSST